MYLSCCGLLLDCGELDPGVRKFNLVLFVRSAGAAGAAGAATLPSVRRVYNRRREGVSGVVLSADQAPACDEFAAGGRSHFNVRRLIGMRSERPAAVAAS